MGLMASLMTNSVYSSRLRNNRVALSATGVKLSGIRVPRMAVGLS